MQILIPAAGLGKRMGAETADRTKAMVSVLGEELISRCLRAVCKFDITRIIIVVGYQKDNFMQFVGDAFDGVEIVYVENPIYDKTNNIYSIYLAKDYLVEDDTILIESDLIFDEQLLQLVVENPSPNLALVEKHKPWMDGTVVKINDDFTISHFISKKDFDFNQIDQYYKTVNIYKFSREFLGQVYVPFLQAYATALGDNEYYEQVLKVIVRLDQGHIKALPIDGLRWYEIDDQQDLDNATVIFSEPAERYELLTKRYGGYWRFEEIKDFCYLVNPYFPPKKLVDEIAYSLPKLVQSYPSGERVQALLAEKTFNIKHSKIVVGNGAAELIEKLSEILPDKFGVFGPTFEEYTARFASAKVFVPEGDGYRYSVSDVIRLSDQTDGVILINPDNPSGNFIPRSDLITLLEHMEACDKKLILDESFLDFADSGFSDSLMNEDDLNQYPNLIVIRSIGKSYGVGGLRLGVMATSDESLLKTVKERIPVWNINSVAEFYMQILGKYKSDYVQSCARLIRARKQFITSLSKISFLQVFPSQANYVFCKVLDRSAKDLAIELSADYSILIKDCSGKHSVSGEYVRFAVMDERSNSDLCSALLSIEAKG